MRKWLFFVKKRLNKSSRKLNKIDTSFPRISAFDCQCYANYALTYNLCNHMSLRCRLLSLYSGRIRDHLLIYEYMSGLFQIWSVCIEKITFSLIKGTIFTVGDILNVRFRTCLTRTTAEQKFEAISFS